MIITIAILAGVAAATLVHANASLVHRIIEKQLRSTGELGRAVLDREIPPPRALTTVYLVLTMAFLAALTWSGSAFLALVVVVLLIGTGKIAVAYAVRRRRERLEQQLPAAISSLAASVRAGLTLPQAIEQLSKDLPKPCSAEFCSIWQSLRLGASLDDALLQAQVRLKMLPFTLVVTALRVNREMGGDVCSSLRRIASSLDRLAGLRQAIYAQTSEGRTNIKVLALAPFGLLLLLHSVDTAAVDVLLHTPVGWLIMVIAGAFTGTGVYWARRIVRQDI